MTEDDRLKNLQIVSDQHHETVDQSRADVNCRLMTITCPCGWKRGVMNMYQCLYCGIWYCHRCAETHFGKTVAEHRRENPIDGL